MASKRSEKDTRKRPAVGDKVDVRSDHLSIPWTLTEVLEVEEHGFRVILGKSHGGIPWGSTEWRWPVPKAEIDLRTISRSKIRPNPWNFNEESPATFEALRENIKENGFLDPIHVVETDDVERPFMILGGEHRFNAAGAEGYEELPCIVLNREKFKDQDLQVFMTNRLNMRGKVNIAKFAQVYADLETRYSQEQLQKLLAFTDKQAWDAITKSISNSVKDALPGGSKGKAAKQLDKELEKAAPGSDIGSIVGRIMSQHGGTLQYGFVVFTFGGQEHHYIPMDTELREALKCFMNAAEEQKVHIAKLLGPILAQAAEDLGHPVSKQD